MPCALSAAGPAPSPPRPSQPRHTWWQGEVPPSPSFSSWPLRRAAWLVPPSRGAVCPCGASRPGLPSARARPEDGSQRIFRRAYNYDAAPGAGGISDSGLIFVSYQADVERQFTPIQRRLDEMDMLNQWTKPIGRPCSPSPPGCREGGFIGEGLFT
ncbi:Dyp-type peroxidase [Pseudarthrobacter oxydans]|uniref:Dyp-type peroxidase domain-containing protein n=1 Tax=Pseudarthrobacter oxydans TaxID=1671 RepID=UPI001571EF80|nr:Dyp-type peroxidase [Pseudarthrobacter oxydans]